MSRIFFLQATVFALRPDRRIIYDADGDTDFTVKINLLDLPNLVVPPNAFVNNDYCCNGYLDYRAGRGCHFVAERRDVVEALKSKPLTIGIFRDDESFPRCHGVVRFSGCVCNLVSESLEARGSFEFGGNFNLIDPGGNPGGNVNLNIDLMDLGSHVVTFFALIRDSFVAKTAAEGCEYKCGRIKDSTLDDSSDESNDNVAGEPSNAEKFMKDVAGICLGAHGLCNGKPEAKTVLQSPEPHEETSDEGKVQEADGDVKNNDPGSTKKTKRR